MQGDCLEKMKDIPDSSIDMVLCDLPYGITKCKWDKALSLESLWKEYKRIVKPYGNILLFGTQPFISEVITSNEKEFSHVWYWVKNIKTGAYNAKKQPMRQVEEVASFITNKDKNNKRNPVYNPQGLVKLEKPKKKWNAPQKVYGGASKPVHFVQQANWPSNLLFYDVDAPKLYPTQKPVSLLAYLIKTYSNQGETVLDNCMGSGSTGVACIQTDRNFIGIELNEEAFQIAYDRIEKAYTEANNTKT